MRRLLALFVTLLLLVSACAQGPPGPTGSDPSKSASSDAQPDASSSTTPIASASATPSATPATPSASASVPSSASASAPPSATPAASASVPPSDLGVLASVQVVDQGKGNAPLVTFDLPLAIEAQTAGLLTPGDGAQVLPGQAVRYREMVLDATTGETLIENFTEVAGGGTVLNDTYWLRFPELFTAFTSARVGAYIAEATPEGGQPAAVSVFQVESVQDAPE